VPEAARQRRENQVAELGAEVLEQHMVVLVRRRPVL
jgi:hypothetical protein